MEVNLFNSYFLLLKDSILSNLMINVNSETLIWVAQQVKDYNMLAILLISFVSIVISFSVNYLIGYSISKLCIKYQVINQKTTKGYKDFNIFFQKYGPFILALSIIPVFGKFITFLSGISQYNFFSTITISSISKLIFFGFLLYSYTFA